MRVLLLDDIKITKLELPQEVSGSFLLKHKYVDSNIVRELSIEAVDGKWVLHASNSVGILNSKNSYLEEVVLENYAVYSLHVIEKNLYLKLYALPTIEPDSSRALVSTNKITIGSSSASSIIYTKPGIKEQEATIYSDGKDWYVSQPGQGFFSEIYLNELKVNKPTKLNAGDIIFVSGLKLIWVKTFIQACMPKSMVMFNAHQFQEYKDEDYNSTEYNPVSEEETAQDLYSYDDYFFHTPNLNPKLEPAEIIIDSPPPSTKMDDNSALLSIGTSLTMLASSFATGFNLINNINNGAPLSRIIPGAVTFTAMILGSLLMPRIAKGIAKNTQRKKEIYRLTKYNAYLDEKEQEITTEMNKQIQILNDNHTTLPVMLDLFYKDPKSAWTREIIDDDFLEVRIGTGKKETQITITAPEEHFTLDDDALFERIYGIVNASRVLENVPLSFSLLKNRISAIICDNNYKQVFLETLFAQIALMHSAADLKIVILNTDDRYYDLSFTKFYPHLFSPDKTIRYYGETLDEIKSLSTSLEGIYKERIEKTNEGEEKKTQKDIETRKYDSYKKFDTYYLIITNDYIASKSLPIIDKIVDADDNYGFSLLILDTAIKNLPNQCNSFLNVMNDNSCIMERNLNNQTKFDPEFYSLDMRDIGTRLLNIPLMEVDEQSSLPGSLSFLEMFGVSKIEQLNITNRWKNNDSTISLASPIGVHTSGEPFYLDLHEKAQGPHGLIAGSTGSGKSEFIITFILSMCVNYHPDDVQFVLIDYKGGGLATAFEKKDIKKAVPHIAGTITNLDAGEINRSLTSINSELKRRQKVFNDSKSITGESTMDIYKYQKFYHEGLVKEPISHLFIISDEFAELKAQQPDFMNELVSTARIGRSLGVHLILATQKPSGVVNEQIWSNTRFRICLKVATRSDSMEMLKRPEAASLKETGRFYLQVGYDEYFDIGQSGWSGAKYVPSDKLVKKTDDDITFINNTGKVIKNVNNIIKLETNKELGDQLTNIVKYLIDLAEKNQYVTKKLWLDNIPEFIYLNDVINKYNVQRESWTINPVIGEYDDPEGQRQDVLKWNIGASNSIIYGASGMGQETILSTIVYSTVATHSPEEINFYIIDMGAETLKVFNKMPHVGEICTSEEVEKIQNLLVMLDEELDSRKDLFADFNGEYQTYIKKSGKKLPQIVCIINNYDGFLESFRKIGELLEPFYRECAKYGISFLITCSSMSSLRLKIAEYFQNKICLQMAKDEDYRNILNAPKKLLPSSYKARGLVKIDKNVFEFQTAYITEIDNINDLIKDTSLKLSDFYKDYKIKRVPVLPDVVTLDLVESELKDLSKVPIGFDISNKSPYLYDFTKEKINVISSNSFDELIPFIYALSTEIATLNNVEVKVIDFSKSVDSLKVGGKIVSTDFDNAVTTIAQEITNESKLQKKLVYFFVGVYNAGTSLSPQVFVNFKNILMNAKKYVNTTFILLDEYNNTKRYQIEQWFLQNANRSAGIWIGEGIGNQSVITYKNVSMEIRKLAYSDMAFVDDPTIGVMPIRKVVVSEVSDEK